jgi:hypothetical protein
MREGYLNLPRGFQHWSRIPERVVAFDASAIAQMVAMSARIELQSARRSPLWLACRPRSCVLEPPYRLGRNRHVMRPSALEIVAGDFAGCDSQMM